MSDGSLRVRVLERAPVGWDGLVESDRSSSSSHLPAVWQALADAFPGNSTRVIAVEERGELVGGAPAMLERRGPFTWLHALPRMLPGTPLARTGRHAEVDRAVATALAGLAREQGVVGGAWSLYRPAGPAPEPGALERVPGETRWVDAAVIDLSAGLDAALARIERKQRQALRHVRARTLALSTEPGHLDRAYAMYRTQARHWGEHHLLPLELSRRLLGNPGVPPAAVLFSLSDARGPVSSALALDGPHETFVWWSGTHAEGRRRGAFALLLWRIVEWAHAQGRLRVNLGASTGLEQVSMFKHGLGAGSVRYPLRWLDASYAAPAGRAVAWVQSHVRRGRTRGHAA